MKAAIDFSFNGIAYKKGDAVNVTDEVALDVLKRRKHIVEGQGKEAEKPEGESMMEKAKDRLAAAEKKEVAPAEKVERTAAGQKYPRRAAKKK